MSTSKILNLHKALVLFSGGQDSATCLAWALKTFEHVETIGFDYGQRHHVELTTRQGFRQKLAALFPEWGQKLGKDHIIPMPGVPAIGETAMTSDQEIAFAETGLPTTFVPGRNLLFFTYAGALAYRRDCSVLVGGMCETDYSGYPDCRAQTLVQQQQTLMLGMDANITIETPLMDIDKKATWALAQELGGAALVQLMVDETHTCYLGNRSTKHKWGYGCNQCPACELRRNGYESWVAS